MLLSLSAAVVITAATVAAATVAVVIAAAVAVSVLVTASSQRQFFVDLEKDCTHPHLLSKKHWLLLFFFTINSCCW